jgi:hypothetical protein
MVSLPTLNKICEKYIDLFDGYDSKKHYVQYCGKARLLLEKSKDGVMFEVRVRIRDKTTLTRFTQFIGVLSSNLEEIMEEAEEVLSTP